MSTDARQDDFATLDSLMSARWSCRAYRPDPVPRHTIERILRAAQKTASWCNSQPWTVIVTSGEETSRLRAKLFEAASGGTAIAPDFPFPRDYTGERLQRRRESGFQLYNAVGIVRGDRAAYARQTLENFKFFGAPHTAVVATAEELGIYGAIDCGGYVTAFMLAAQALGIATIAQASLASRSDIVRDHFSLPADRRVVCGISFGFPDLDHPSNAFRTNRADLPEVVTFVGD